MPADRCPAPPMRKETAHRLSLRSLSAGGGWGRLVRRARGGDAFLLEGGPWPAFRSHGAIVAAGMPLGPL